MVKRIGSRQRKTRYKLQRHFRQKGKIPLSQYFQQLQDGDSVSLVLNSAVQHGYFFPRFHGLTGVVCGKRGRCYEVRIADGGKEKLLVVHPIHLKKQIHLKK